MKYLRILFIIFSFSILAFGQDINDILEKVWINEDVVWKSPPPDISRIIYSDNSSLFYFCPNGCFNYVLWPIAKSYKYGKSTLQVTGGTINIGKWENVSDKIQVKCRVIERSMPIVGKEIPEEIHVDTLEIISYGKLKFRDKFYIPFECLNDLSLNILTKCDTNLVKRYEMW